MSNRKVAALQPTEVTYKQHTIRLTHRPKTNDWQYTYTHTRTRTYTNVFPRYDTALKHAQQEIDILVGDAA